MASCSFSARQIAAEMLHDHLDRVHRGLSQPADRRIGHDPRQLGEHILVPARLVHQHDSLLGADPARRALAAAFILEKAQQVERHRLHIVLVGQNDDRSACVRYRARPPTAPHGGGAGGSCPDAPPPPPLLSPSAAPAPQRAPPPPRLTWIVVGGAPPAPSSKSEEHPTDPRSQS